MGRNLDLHSEGQGSHRDGAFTTLAAALRMGLRVKRGDPGLKQRTVT